MLILYTIIPCYNEEDVLTETSKRLKDKYEQLMERNIIAEQSRIVFVNDGSADQTWKMISELHKNNQIFSGINLSCNRGHQNALLAGLMTVKNLCDVTISMDADLQDDINAIDEMVEKYKEGCDVVYGVRDKRKKDTMFKKMTAEMFYKMLGTKVIFNHADYRLMSQKALKGLAEFKEVNLFLRGIVPMVGFRSDTVYYERGERFAGESKYPLKKMLAFAFEGITSLSTKLIRLISMLGLFIFTVSIGILIWSFIMHFTGNTIKGWSSTVISLWTLGGLQLLAIGVVGEYIGKIYLETKGRPRFIIDEFLNE